MTITKKIKTLFKRLGPGVITGAADDDPSGIATHSQAGAQFGYHQLWLDLYLLPLMIAVQEACARIGAVTGKGLAAVLKNHYPKPILYLSVGLVIIANILNIGADIGAMAAAANLIIPISLPVLAILFTTIILSLEILTSYRTYSKILKILVLALLSYPITLFIINEPWTELLKATVIPQFKLETSFLFVCIAVLGTTISPYLFFWQASEEVEEEKAHHLFNHGKPKINNNFIRNLRQDTFVGMFFSNLAAWCIIAVSGTVLHQANITSIETAADAAKAIEPLVQSFPNAGFWAKCVFATGIIGLGLLAIPILSGSAAYALSEVFGWNEGLNHKFHRAYGFYGIITASTLIGLLINFLGLNPMKTLIYAAVANGFASIPLIFIIRQISQNRKIMGEHTGGWLSNLFLYLTFFAISITGIILFLSLFNLI